jgi:MoaA/NifB/PqqE/SkfB family radical SAM enzyme
MNSLSKLIDYKLYDWFGFPKTFPMNLTLGLSYKCNSRCKTCNIWKKKKFDKEMSLEEFEKIFRKIGRNKLYVLILTGGEPFLYKDIDKICEYAERYCRPNSIVIPTNCILGDYVLTKTKQILEKCKRTHITINLSLDGIEGEQDKIRGVPGNFKKTMLVYQELKKLEKEHKNFDVSMHTVISKFNYKDFEEVFNYVTKKLKPENYITEVAENRHELDNMEKDITPTYEEYSSKINFLIKDLEKQKNLNTKQALRLEYYKLVKETLRRKTQVIPCYAGIASAQIDPTGELWFCCVRAESIGNVRDVDYDLMKLWYNKKAMKQRKSIRNKECYCPLASASYTNIALNPTKSLKVVSNFITSRFK